MSIIIPGRAPGTSAEGKEIKVMKMKLPAGETPAGSWQRLKEQPLNPI